MNAISRHRTIKDLQAASESHRLHRGAGIIAGHTVGRIARLTCDTPRPTTCQWLEGEPRERNFCGDATQPGSSYCATHHARCFIKRPLTQKGE